MRDYSDYSRLKSGHKTCQVIQQLISWIMLEIAWATRDMLANKHLWAPEICWLLSHKKNCWISKLGALESTDSVLESNFSRKFRVSLSLFETSACVNEHLLYLATSHHWALKYLELQVTVCRNKTLHHQEITILPIQCPMYCNFNHSIDIPLLKWGCREVSL